MNGWGNARYRVRADGETSTATGGGGSVSHVPGNACYSTTGEREDAPGKREVGMVASAAAREKCEALTGVGRGTGEVVAVSHASRARTHSIGERVGEK